MALRGVAIGKIFQIIRIINYRRLYMKEFILKILKQIASLFTDNEWDADIVKVCGFALIVVGLIGWWCGKSDFQWVVLIGGTMISTGKFSVLG